MAKSSLNRHHNARLLNNWRREAKASQSRFVLDQLSFGSVNKQDPFDCGNPGCGLCSYRKYTPSDRQQLRKQEREAREELTTE